MMLSSHRIPLIVVQMQMEIMTAMAIVIAIVIVMMGVLMVMVLLMAITIIIGNSQGYSKFRSKCKYLSYYSPVLNGKYILLDRQQPGRA